MGAGPPCRPGQPGPGARPGGTFPYIRWNIVYCSYNLVCILVYNPICFLLEGLFPIGWPSLLGSKS